MELTHEDVRKIIELIDGATDLNEVEIVYGGFRLYVRRDGGGGQTPMAAMPSGPRAAPAVAQAPAAMQPPTPAPVPAPAVVVRDDALAEGEVAIRAPMLGTFYRRPSPAEPPFVEVGQRVRADDTVCLIEVMKLFNSIRAGVDGVIARIAAENGAMVEYNQVLIVIAPDSKS